MASRRLIVLCVLGAAAVGASQIWRATRIPTNESTPGPGAGLAATTSPDAEADSRLDIAAVEAPPAALPPLHLQMLATPEPERNAVFKLALDDSTYACQRILHSVPLSEVRAIWYVACADMAAYWLDIGIRGDIGIEPIIYTDGLPVLPIPERVEPVQP
jgi:hypothetical protein